jgi:lactose/L-arabinose transport system permease protein
MTKQTASQTIQKDSTNGKLFAVIGVTLKYLFLSVTALLCIFPFIWMVLGMTSSSQDITSGKIAIGNQLLNNFSKLNEMVNLPQVLGNSAILTLIGTIATLFVASMAGYGFEMYRNAFREKIYNVLLLTMMVPFAAIMIPLFRIFAGTKLLNSYVAVILPSIASIFVIFYFRQCTKSFAKELIQASRVDGLNEFQSFFYIYVPSMKSTYAAASIIVFMSYWNSFLWPLIVLQSNSKKTITLAISSLASSYTPDFGVIMTAIIIATLPTLILFFTMQKQFVEGMLGSVK